MINAVRHLRRLAPQTTLRLIAFLSLLFSPLVALAAQTLPYTLETSYPHQPALFTQGLELYQGRLFESSGLYGHSKVVSRAFPPKAEDSITGTVLPSNLFAEGLSLYRGKLYMLTWRAGKGLVLDPHHFKLLDVFDYAGQGWGLCASVNKDRGDFLVMSNGSDQLQWIDANTLKLSHKVNVNDAGQPVDQLNELECHGDYIIANQWHKSHLLIIHAVTGNVLAKLDLSALALDAAKSATLDPEAVLNGIAYDPSDDSWLITGKLWPKIYRIKFDLSKVKDLQKAAVR
ncbi:MAG: glutaminyl-peptide cyclotransferase [Zhongshania sp.]|uniref:glutaminyl-peptide cyclotransferase n=1 Tax=Zhongshania sp. TaxID=1971902 RepID=UPI0026206AC6|nr:glutaminyl-peptide cyclotransferase [Zhongshania sp.]MDF1691052.1 glutaminyl-peptide cyclotransferase [Zhongshania sp.]